MNRLDDGKLQKLANYIIKKYEHMELLKDIPVRIAFQYSDKEKKSKNKSIFAECDKVNEKYSLFCPYDFLITFYEPNTAFLSDKAFELLMYHELRHIGINEKGFYIIPHSVEDFKDIIKKYGIDWIDK